MENIVRATLDAMAPVRRVTYNGCPYYCSVDMGKLFGIKGREMEKLVDYQQSILIPCKGKKENSKPLRFMTELTAYLFVGQQLRKKGLINDESAEWQITLFMKTLKQNKLPSILTDKTVKDTMTLKRLPAGVAKCKAERTDEELDTLSCLSLIKMYKSFVNDVRIFVGA